ncbi:hypothetical protein I6E17_02065 [Fusobacterium perfoetens]|jgi:hypothetical protein|uniref:hypothetical protein n=1 Tax=Fusobacterium perfoetens TaxID=852 RepID=UPI001F385988|nr:hypothetical protein [Fusobacterium perfoetens]MCF2624961.1 hypothetical protein [Fusobacterium perfoetens]
MKKYMNFKYINGECLISYKIKDFAVSIKGKGVSETAKEVARITNEIYNAEFI